MAGRARRKAGLPADPEMARRVQLRWGPPLTESEKRLRHNAQKRRRVAAKRAAVNARESVQ